MKNTFEFEIGELISHKGDKRELGIYLGPSVPKYLKYPPSSTGRYITVYNIDGENFLFHMYESDFEKI